LSVALAIIPNTLHAGKLSSSKINFRYLHCINSP